VYREVIDELHNSLKTLHLTLAENISLIECLQADLLGVRQQLEDENRKRRQWETKFHRVNREVRGRRVLGAGDRSESQGEHRHSMSDGSTTRNVDFPQR